MALTGEYSAQEGAVVLIGATVLDNVRSVSITATPTRNIRRNAAFGAIHSYRSVGDVTVTATINFFDEEGLTADLKAYRVNNTTGIDQTLKIRLEGTGAGLPELILDPTTGYYGMDLVDHSFNAESGEEYPLVDGSMTWEGTFAEEPAWTAQS